MSLHVCITDLPAELQEEHRYVASLKPRDVNDTEAHEHYRRACKRWENHVRRYWAEHLEREDEELLMILDL